MKNVAGDLTLSSAEFQAGLIGWGYYASNVKVRVPLQSSVEDFNAAVDAASRGNYSDALGASLEWAFDEYFYADPNNRASSPKLIVMMTDAIGFTGGSTDANLLIATADAIRARGDEIIFVLIDDAASSYANDTRDDGVDFPAAFLSAVGGDSTKIITAATYTTELVSASVTNLATSKTCALAEAIAPSDSTAPTLSFSPTDGDTAVSADTNITITFNEAIRNIDNTALSDSNVDALITLSVGGSGGAAIPFDATINADKTVITINPTDNLTEAATIYVGIGATVEDAADNAISASSGTFTVASNDPSAKADVVGIMEAMSNVAIRFNQTSVKMVNSRLDWLRRNQNSPEKSRQGITVSFANPWVEDFVNGDQKSFKAFKLADAASWVQEYAQDPDQVMTDVVVRPLEIAMAEAKERFGDIDLNSTGGPLFADWSLWTDGHVRIGKIKSTATSSKQDTDAFSIGVGIDRYDDEDNNLFGFALTIGKDDVDIGESGSGVVSDNYSFSIYSAFQPEKLPLLEGVLGIGHLKMDSTRIDGSQTLTGNRNTNMLFGSLTSHAEAYNQDDFVVSPYGRMEMAYIELDGYQEAGGSLSLVFDRQRIRRAMLFLGADINYETSISGGKLKPFGKLEYGLDLTGQSDAGMHYVGSSTNYTLGINRKASSHWKVGIGTDYEMREGLTSSVSYEREQAINAGHSDSLSLQLNISF